MVRFTLSMLFYVLVAKWGYNEVGVIYPDALPLIDASLEKISIPTHDQWSKDTVHEWVGRVAETVDEANVGGGAGGILSLAKVLELQDGGINLNLGSLTNSDSDFTSSRRQLVHNGSGTSFKNNKSRRPSIEEGMLNVGDVNSFDSILGEINQ